MARTQQLARLIALAPFLFVLLFSRPAHAQDGISVTVWDNTTADNAYNNAPPLPPTTPVAGELIAATLTQNFDAAPLFGLTEDFVVRFTGWLTPPSTGDYQFYLPADDGVQMYLNGSLLIDDWYDKGGGGSISQPITLTAGQAVPFTVWFYENGGGAWLDAYWLHNNQWEQIPGAAFTTTNQTTTVPTTAPETTTTTTTIAPTTTQQTAPPTTLPPTTTEPETTTTTTIQPTTTTTPITVPAGSTTTHQPVTTTAAPATTLPAPATTTTVLPSTTTTPETAAQTTTTTDPLPEPTQATLPSTPDYQSATIVRGGVIGKGLKPAALISNGLRDGVTPAQQRMIVTAAVVIAIPSPISVARRKP